VKYDTSLQEKLKAVGDSAAVAAIAKNAGFMASSDDISLSFLLLQLTSLSLKTTERGKEL
jgi:predicted ribosomally synthesized peptide with nif11-like leader